MYLLREKRTLRGVLAWEAAFANNNFNFHGEAGRAEQVVWVCVLVCTI